MLQLICTVLYMAACLFIMVYTVPAVCYNCYLATDALMTDRLELKVPVDYQLSSTYVEMSVANIACVVYVFFFENFVGLSPIVIGGG